jgi:Nif-specific regulatory protein
MDGIVGRSPALVAMLRQAALVAPLDVNVLLTGDSGTGKSQLARIIHLSGPRAQGPFVELNTAALPEQLLESELFGAMPGAHSTATRRLEGKVAAADGGTLFLDEIADMPLSSQAKLLQLLHSREYYPLGSPRAVRANIRVIAATNTDLDRAVLEKRFRQDLLYRLQVVPLRVPSLAERREDVAALARYFVDNAGRQHRLGSFTLSRGAITALESTEWPGNVRQLAHAVEAGVIRAAGEGVAEVQAAHVFPGEHRDGGSCGPATFQVATRQFQARLIQRALEETDWNVPETARRLDLGRSHVYNLIRSFGLNRNVR